MWYQVPTCGLLESEEGCGGWFPSQLLRVPQPSLGKRDQRCDRVNRDSLFLDPGGFAYPFLENALGTIYLGNPQELVHKATHS